MSWQVDVAEIAGRRFVHTHPLDDSIVHLLEAGPVSSCPCGPITTQMLQRDYSWHHVYASLDGRELSE